MLRAGKRRKEVETLYLPTNEKMLIGTRKIFLLSNVFFMLIVNPTLKGREMLQFMGE